MEKVSSASHVVFQWMVQYLLLLLNLPVCLNYYSGNRYQFACVGQDVHIAVDSRSRLVTFHRTAWQGPRKVVLENTSVKDPRYEWMRNMTLVIRNVTSEDQGLYSIKSPITGFSFETVRLTVSDCLKRFSRNYGGTFKLEIPQHGDMLEFLGSSPSGTPKPSSFTPTIHSPAETVVVWTRAKSEIDRSSRGHLRDRYWVIDNVAPDDQGIYTIKDSNGTVLSRISLTVRAHIFNLTLFSKESLFVQLWGQESRAQLFFRPAQHATPTTPPSLPLVMFQDGGIVNGESRYEGRMSLLHNNTGTYMVISALSGKDNGIYELWDAKDNLVSRTVITVKDRNIKWRAVIKSISVPSGMFATLAGFILFMKRYPKCSVTNILSGLRDRHRSTRASRSQDYSGRRASVKRNSTSSYSGYISVITTTEKNSPSSLRMRCIEEETRSDSGVNHTDEMITEHDAERKISVSVPGDVDWLKPSEACVQFDIESKGGGGLENNEKESVSTLPLNTDTSHVCSVYTSEKLQFL